jgi:arginase family enzyme
MTSFEALEMLHGLKGLNVVGGDVVEVAPPFDPSGITALAGATIDVRDFVPGCGGD